ncbi:copper resistance system multicopper oxidase [Planctomycetes bacterium TBK1r]|uniref:Copper resistance protein A n=1 Tax=Stieleria magnilauensis TaxID=2527963 RepID=A0ABX5XUF4_9BACT|nr:Copper resistance protein A precursor [Planctomycetes bacterium TBK1r]
MIRLPRNRAQARHGITRRRFVTTSSLACASLALNGCSALGGVKNISRRQEWGAADIVVERRPVGIEGRSCEAVTLNGSVPGPTLRYREGETATIRVQNRLDVDTSVHWHGLILPPNMDGVPGVSFRGIAPGETFTYHFPIRQSGTYWYHSHSGFQEQLGMFGALVIEPVENDPIESDVEHVVLLSDWTFEDPMRILARLKKKAGYYNFQKPTIAADGLGAILANRTTWGRMRMDPTDISDVTGASYTFLMNGMGPESNWTGLYEAGQTVRLRLVNAAAASYFDVSIPGLAMTVVQADGQNIEPVTVDELRISIAETYDVLVRPKENRAYTLFAESMDRSGYARGTLAPQMGMSAEIPLPRKRPLLGMQDMGMAGMASMNMAQAKSVIPGKGMGRMQEQSAISNTEIARKTTSGQKMSGTKVGHGKEIPTWAQPVPHNLDNHGPANTNIPDSTKGRLDQPGIGLDDAEHRVLVYTDLRRLVPADVQVEPEREIEMHLTGNMEKYIWGFDGKKYSESSEPVQFRYGERLRITFVNDTMMNHPIHLHGMWMELVNGAGKHQPRKHTVNVKPAERVSLDVTVDAIGKWAMHCHILYHMDSGMFRVVEVTESPQTEIDDVS